MRPVSLSAEGFGPFRDRIDVSFDDAEFFAFVGPTGAGKSSVIDAMCFALYGFVPRYDDNRLVAPAITSGASQAKISFTFDVGGERYIATRVVRRTPTGGATTRECRIEHVIGADTEVVAGDKAQADKVVPEILGLTSEQFTKCVVLPQGDFAQFLHETPGKRQDLLVKLLGLEIYGQMASRARSEAAALRNQATGLDAQLADLTGATEEAERSAAKRVEKLTAAQRTIEEAGPSVRDARAAVERAEDGVGERDELMSKLEAVEIPDLVTVLAERLTTARHAVETLTEIESKAEQAATAAEQATDEAPDPTTLNAALATRRDLDKVDAALPGLAVQASRSLAAKESADASLHEAESAMAEAEEGRRALRDEHVAHALAAGLVIGQPCPVCAVEVTLLPKSKAPGALARAEKQVESQRRLQAEAKAAAHQANAVHQRTEAELESLRQRRAELATAVTDKRTVEELEAEADRVKALQQQARELRQAAGGRRRDLDAARRQLDVLGSESEHARGDYTLQRDGLAGLGPPAPSADLATDWAALVGWSLKQRGSVAAELKRLRKQRDRLVETEIRLLGKLISLANKAGLTIEGAGTSYDDLRAAIAREEERAKADLDRVLEDRRRAETLSAERERVLSDAGLYADLGRLLSANGFEAWVLTEALDDLVEGASVTLDALSQGAYSLGTNDSGEFVVVDHREADAVRPAKTLSGGETFQASLALALALADHLGQFSVGGASKLESIFLDEGFGTLDEDSLDVVAATLEPLAGGSRVVGIVTHVKELAERVPVRFDVRRTGRTAVVERLAP